MLKPMRVVCVGVPVISAVAWSEPCLAATTAELRFERPAAQDAPAKAEQQAESKALAEALEPTLRFADRGTWNWSVQGGVAFIDESTDYNLGLNFHYFLTDRFEINFGVGGWVYDQDDDAGEQDEGEADGETALGVNPAFGFRWHFWMPKEKTDRSWSVYADFGIGMVFTDEEVPPGGTTYNFTPRAGVGATFALGDSGTRLDLGVRWQHISNASTSGTDDNPSRDSPMVYIGVMFPF